MAAEEVIAAFAVRRKQLDRIVSDLAAEKETSRAQHHLIVGQRGMGKTMILARIAAEMRTNADLSARFIPLVFAEEQYAVDRLSKFWLNCLDSLADARELSNDYQAVDEIDRTVASLTAREIRTAKDDQPFADEVYTAFVEAAKVGGQRPVLLVDNLQLVFERLEAAQQHSLRELLMRRGSPIVVGASPISPQTDDYGAAFYDHFKMHYLRPLDESEMRSLLIHLSDVADRDDVRQRVLQHPARFKVLRQLTGGNPRTTATLFLLYAEDFAPSVFRDLEGLLDRVTPLYKARFEELTPQQQVVASAVANHWDPITAAELVVATGLPPGTISSQLDRLEKIGFVERTDLFGETRTGYQLAERFFNIWFLMRSASRRQRREVEFLTRFLESFYEPADRTRLARQLMDEDRFSADRYVLSRAVAASLTEREIAAELTRHAELTVLQEEAREARARLRDLIDFDSLPHATLAFDELRKKLAWLVPEDSQTSPEAFAKAVLGDCAMLENGERERLAARTEKLSTEEVAAVIESTQKGRAAQVERYSQEAVDWLSHRLATGQIRTFRDAEDWNRAFVQAPDTRALRIMLAFLPGRFGKQLDETSIARIREAFEPTTTSDGAAWRNWAWILSWNLNRDQESEVALRESIARAPDDAWSWDRLGTALSILNRLDEAEAAHRKALALDPESSWAWFHIGKLFERLRRFSDAEAAFRKSIALDQKFEWGWLYLGDVLLAVDRIAEAENAYRKSIAADPSLQWAWRALADVLKRLQRFEEAEVAYRRAIEIDPTDVSYWSDLAQLLMDHLHRLVEAEAACRRAITIAPNSAWARCELGDLLMKYLGRFEEAEAAYRQAIAIEPKSAYAWNSLGNLYCDHLDRSSDAAVAFDNALAQNAQFQPALHNRLFLHRDFMGEGASAHSFLEGLHALRDLGQPDSLHLHEALFAAYDGNWGITREALGRALAIRSDGFDPSNIDAWYRATAVLLHLNYGAELLAFLEERGDTARLRPWYEAVRALQAGDRRMLQNIAPEIRTTAEIFYDGIETRLKKLPEKTRRRPLPQSKPKRRSKKQSSP